MSDELKQFYRELWAWVQAGCPSGHPMFDRRKALCSTVISWAKANRLNVLSLKEDQTEQFKTWSGGVLLPFNLSVEEWLAEANAGDFYSNPERLIFIEVHAI